MTRLNPAHRRRRGADRARQKFGGIAGARFHIEHLHAFLDADEIQAASPGRGACRYCDRRRCGRALRR